MAPTASISNIGKRDTLWFFPRRLIKECQRLVGPISVSGQSTWGPKAGNAGAGNPSTYTMDDDDAVEASAPLSRKGGASAGKGHLFLAGFKLYNSICRRLSKTCFLLWESYRAGVNIFWRLLCHPTQAGIGLMWNCMQIIGHSHSRQFFWCYGVLHQHRLTFSHSVHFSTIFGYILATQFYLP